MGLERMGPNSLECMGLERMGANNLERMGPAMGPALGQALRKWAWPWVALEVLALTELLRWNRATLEEASQLWHLVDIEYDFDNKYQFLKKKKLEKKTVFDYSRGTGNRGTFISILHCYGPSRKNPSPAGVFSSCCLALDSSSSFPCPAFRAIAKSFTTISIAVTPPNMGGEDDKVDISFLDWVHGDCMKPSLNQKLLRCRASDPSDHGSVSLVAASGVTVSDTTVAAFPATEEDENLWIASRLIWFDQPSPPDSSQTAPVKIGPSP
ncbi:hypothetical protein STEG23_018143 [Scotinomys teguina]